VEIDETISPEGGGGSAEGILVVLRDVEGGLGVFRYVASRVPKLLRIDRLNQDSFNWKLFRVIARFGDGRHSLVAITRDTLRAVVIDNESGEVVERISAFADAGFIASSASTDGRWIAGFMARRAGAGGHAGEAIASNGVSLYDRLEHAFVPVSNTVGVYDPQLSPDGLLMAFREGDGRGIRIGRLRW
jgi:hypothetical protein